MTVRASLGSDRAQLGLITLGGDIGFPGKLSPSQSQAVALVAVVARTRLLTQQGGQQRILNTSFEADTLGGAPAGWAQFLNNGAPAPTTFAVQNGWASDGAKSMRLTTGNHTATGQALCLIQSGISVVAGARYVFGCDVNVLSLLNTMVARCMIEWHDASGAYISQSYGLFSPGAANSGQVVRSGMQVLAPSTAATGRAIFHITGGTGVGDVYVDNFTFQYVPTLIAAVSRTFAVTASQAAAVAGARSRQVTASQAQSLALGRSSAGAVAGAQGATVTLAQALTAARTASQAQSPAVGRSTASAMAGAQAATVSLVRVVAAAHSASQAQSLALGRSTAGALAGAQAAAVTLVRAVAAAYTASQAAAVARATATPPATFTASQAGLPALGRAIARTFGATQSRAVTRAAGVSRILALGQDQGASTRTGGSLRMVAAQEQLAAWRALSARTVRSTQPQTIACAGSASRRFSVSAASIGQRSAALDATLLVTQPSAVSTVRIRSREDLFFASQSQAVSRAGLRPVLRVSLSQAANATRSESVSVTLFVAQDQGANVPMRLTRGVLTADVLEARADHDILRPRVLVGAVAASTLESEQQ